MSAINRHDQNLILLLERRALKLDEIVTSEYRSNRRISTPQGLEKRLQRLIALGHIEKDRHDRYQKK